MALLSNRTQVATEDENGDGVIDRQDDRMASHRAGTTAVLPARAPAVTGKARVDEELAAQRRLEARAAAASPTTTATITRDDSEVIPLGPRPRASMMATLSLVFGIAAALLVLTGVLAGLGVGVGLLATFAAIGGIAATSRRHVAGKGDAMLGMALGLAAIVVGTLAITGNLPWLDTNTDQVTRVHDWLSVRVPWMFPNS